MSTNIQASSFKFLNKLSKNNNREWFNENKSLYIEEHEKVISFSDSLLEEIKTFDKIETATGKKALHRIYRDVRFSKNKEPYKNNWSGSFKRATNLLRGGFYFHIEPGNSFAAGGFWGPNKDDLLKLRKGIESEESEFRKILGSKEFKEVFGELLGDQLKTAPKGFDKEASSIDLLRYKQHILKHDFTDEEVQSKDFHKKVAAVFLAMHPLFDLMSYILTTDENGTPLFED
tara:strand:+ start:1462 stop:2154 length:693 start_codon:yes stop_codon:yes gene_type:complete